MKILYVVDYYQPDIGYSEYFLPHELKKMGHEVTILTSNYYFPFPDYDASAGKLLGPRKHDTGTYTQEDGITVIKEKMLFEIFTRAIFGNHEKYIKLLKPDVVIINKTAGWNAIRMAQLKSKYGYQLITCDAHLPSGFAAVGNLMEKNIFYFIFRLLFARLLNEQGDAHIAVQEGTVEIMRDYYGIKDIVHIPLGTDTTRFRADKKAGAMIRRRFGIPADAFVITYTGKIVPTKGVHILFSAFNYLAPKYSNTYLLLVGDGSSGYINTCFSNLNPAYHQRVIMAGFQKNKGLYKYYSAANVGVWPLEESTSMNDAASCELPFIANDQVGVRLRFANNNAMVYKRGDSSDLARKLEYLLKHPKESRAMGMRGRELSIKELSWRAIASKYLSAPFLKFNSNILSGLDWLIRAQSVTKDGGVSAYFSFLSGWAPSFIETTGYIIPTLLEASKDYPQKNLIQYARQMGDFLLSMQLVSGGFRTYTPGEKKHNKPTVFNTAQDIIGLIALYKVTLRQKYLKSAIKAANFLVKIQEKDGTWKKFTDFSEPKTYHSRVALALLEVYKCTKTSLYRSSAVKALDWVISQQKPNGFVLHANLPVQNYPLPITHTLAYVAEGLWYSGISLKNKRYLLAAEKIVKPIAIYLNSHPNLPAYFDPHWQPSERFGCPTGDAQFAILMVELYHKTKNELYRSAAWKLVNNLSLIQGKNWPSIRGGIPGCTPIYGDLARFRGYCRGCYINWATKFGIDAFRSIKDL